VADPLGELLLRYARTHGPFPASAPATRLGLSPEKLQPTLHALAARDKLVEGAFRRGETDAEWCDPEILRSIRRRSLARLRQEVEPVEPRGARPLHHPLAGSAAAVERARGSRTPCWTRSSEAAGGAAARVGAGTRDPAGAGGGYLPGDIDALAAAGEIVWVGVSPLGPRDGRVALYSDRRAAQPAPGARSAAAGQEGTLNDKERAVLAFLQAHGASFFAAIHDGTDGGFPQSTVDALWSLVWKGLCTNDTFRALRAFARGPAGPKQAACAAGAIAPGRRDGHGAGGFRSRRSAPAAAEGRWSLVADAGARPQRRGRHRTSAAALAQQLLARYGLVTREVGAAEELPGGFSAVYEVLRTMEETGKIRRGYFVGGVAAMQFALAPGAGDAAWVARPSRATRGGDPAGRRPGQPLRRPAALAGNAAAAPDRDDSDGDSRRARRTRGPTRTVGSYVILVDGALGAWVGRGGRQLYTFLPPDEPDRGRVAAAVASAVARLAGGDRRVHRTAAGGDRRSARGPPPAGRRPGRRRLPAHLRWPAVRPPRDPGDGRSIRQPGRAGAS
jgi:ATP-dependent Lhr-like helicase